MRYSIFESARLRLTFWYLLIIALISLSFSAIIYRDIVVELTRSFQKAESRIIGAPGVPIEHKPYVLSILEEDLIDSKKVVLLRLLVINGIILGVAGVGGYFLAGATLSPIKLMIEEQKRFIADASHELKTPITSLLTETEVALRNKKLSLYEAKKHLKSNQEEATRMKEFTAFLLTLSKHDVNGNGFPKEKVDLSEAARMAIERNATLAKKAKIKINHDLKEVITYGSPGSLVELVSILINNAIKYSPQGKKVNIAVWQFSRKAVLEVKDQGIGIAKKDLQHIFDRFYRIDPSRSKRNVDGYGLGLSIAKSIVDAHKGEIQVKSSLGVGTTFRVTLPKV